MPASKNFTTTLGETWINWLDQQSDALNISKRALIEQGLEKLKKSQIQDALAQGYEAAAQDADWKSLEREGFSDFESSLKKQESCA